MAAAVESDVLPTPPLPVKNKWRVAWVRKPGACVRISVSFLLVLAYIALRFVALICRNPVGNTY